MATIPNDDASANGQSAHRLRFDPTLSAGRGSGHSGRRLVVVAVLTVLVGCGALSLAFRDWRSRVRARAAFGASQVAPTVDPLVQMVPDGIAPEAWREAVEQTHALLVALTAANLLDQAQMTQLRDELAARVGAARPETARGELRSIWNDMCARAGPVLTRRARPTILE